LFGKLLYTSMKMRLGLLLFLTLVATAVVAADLGGVKNEMTTTTTTVSTSPIMFTFVVQATTVISKKKRTSKSKRCARGKPATAKWTTSAATACNVRCLISVSRLIAGATVVIAGVTGIVAVAGGASRILVHEGLLHHALTCHVLEPWTAVSV
jgi:hypothetical protein